MRRLYYGHVGKVQGAELPVSRGSRRRQRFQVLKLLIMRVLFLTRYNEQGASSRCRVYQYLPSLAACDIRGEVIHWMPSSAELGQRAGAVDAVFLQKRVPPLAQLLLLRRRSPYLLFDFDDAIWLRRRRDNTVCSASPRTRLRLAMALRLVDRVIAGNEYLASYARRWSRCVTVLSTPIDEEYYDPARADSGSRGLPAGGSGTPASVCLGWVGHPSNLTYLRRIEPALASLARRYQGLTLRVICSDPFDSVVIPVDNIPWSLSEEVANLRGIDIGLMPLEDDAWTRGKCGYKALQYLAAGIPAVCSPVGMNAQIITEGETGLLAADLPDWEQQIARLILSPALRERLGAAGREAALQDYSLERLAPRLAQLLASGVPAPRRHTPEAGPPARPPSPFPSEPAAPPQEPVTGGTAPR